jgi:hypothetical protein
MSDTASIFSNVPQMRQLQLMVTNYLRLPFATDTIPGSLLEAILGYIHDAEVLKTYDFVDVVSVPQKVGWQVKSTKSSTPVTWIRGKIPRASSLVEASRKDEEGIQLLGNAIINFCNEKVVNSFEKYALEQIGYARLVLFPNNTIMYYERLLVTRDHPQLFNPADYIWKWSVQKENTKKEQLPAFIGIHRETQTKHFAWHGLGENQLHFYGESAWWPPSNDIHRLDFKTPDDSQKVNFEKLAEWLAQLQAEPIEESKALPIVSDNNGGTALPT